MAVTASSTIANGKALAAARCAGAQQPIAANKAAPVAMPTRKKYWTAHGSHAAS